MKPSIMACSSSELVDLFLRSNNSPATSVYLNNRAKINILALEYQHNLSLSDHAGIKKAFGQRPKAFFGNPKKINNR